MEWKHLLTLFFLFLLASEPVLAQNQTAEEYMIQIDPNTRVVETNWNQEQVSILFESDIPRPITITDVNSIAETGASQVNFKRTTLTSGKTRVNMSVESRRGSKTVTIAAGENMIAISNPTKPLLESISRADFYIFGVLAAISSAVQVLLRKLWMNYRLKKGLIRVV